MSEYQKTCVFCKGSIKMSDKEGGKWLPYNQDGSQHDCKKEKNTKENGHKMKMKKIRLGTISGDLAEAMARALESEDILRYQPVGPRLLDVYLEKYTFRIQTLPSGRSENT